jgi:hypothetical protein
MRSMVEGAAQGSASLSPPWKGGAGGGCGPKARPLPDSPPMAFSVIPDLIRDL